MKTNVRSFIVSACALVCALFLFSACNPESLSVHDVEGAYNGTLEAEVNDVSLGTVGTAVATVTSPDNQGLKITFEKLKVGSFNLGTFTVDCGVQYDETDGEFDLYGQPQVVFGEYGTVPVLVSGEANGGLLELDLDITALNLELEYKGFKKK